MPGKSGRKSRTHVHTPVGWPLCAACAPFCAQLLHCHVYGKVPVNRSDISKNNINKEV